jgi:hypothetical protein
MKSFLLLASLVAMTACTTVAQTEGKKESLSQENQNAILDATSTIKK